MKRIIIILYITHFIAVSQNNIAINGSFENTNREPSSTGQFIVADSVSSSNNTSIDIFSTHARYNGVKASKSYMGKQDPATGNYFMGIVTYYGDEAGIFTTIPGYQRYSEYIQIPLLEPMEPGRSYEVGFSVSLASESAFANSGIGMYFSDTKLNEKNNTYLNVYPHLVSFEIINSTGWVTIYGNYVAKGGEKYITVGSFPDFMLVEKIIPEYANNSRKAYYYIDDIFVNSTTLREDLAYANTVTGVCFKMGNVNFEANKSVILPGSYQELETLADFLVRYPYLIIYVNGYTVTDELNTQLAEDRAEAIRNFLVSKGIPGSQIITGSHASINRNEEQTGKNNEIPRRVEIIACTFIE